MENANSPSANPLPGAADPTKNLMPTSYKFQFTGKAGEYFKIWIVNLALTLATLGIFSAWAKVRSRRYFYGNTHLDGSTFNYTANPIAILKGRAIMFVFFVLYAVGEKIDPIVALIAFGILMLLFPWIYVRAMIFNNSNTNYRGIRFGFKKDYISYYTALLWGGFIAVITLGVCTPYIDYRRTLLTVDHSRYGKTYMKLNGNFGSFWAIYFFSGLFYMGIVIVVALLSAGGGLFKVDETLTNNPAFEQVKEQREEVERIQEKIRTIGESDGFTIEEKREKLSEAKDELEAAEAAYNKKVKDVAKTSTDDALKNFLNWKLYIFIVLFYGGIFVALAFMKSQMFNYVWNRTRIGSFYFKANMNFGTLLGMYIVNLVVCLLTLGLAYPWARIRLARYRAECLTMHGTAEQSLADFAQSEQASEDALGDAGADFWDMDLGF